MKDMITVLRDMNKVLQNFIDGENCFCQMGINWLIQRMGLTLTKGVKVKRF